MRLWGSCPSGRTAETPAAGHRPRRAKGSPPVGETAEISRPLGQAGRWIEARSRRMTICAFSSWTTTRGSGHRCAERCATRGDVDAAANGGSALARILEVPGPDVVLLALGLPDRDGLGVLREIRAAGVLTPVLAVTARAAIGDRVAGLDAGADDYRPPSCARRTVRSWAVSGSSVPAWNWTLRSSTLMPRTTASASATRIGSWLRLQHRCQVILLNQQGVAGRQARQNRPVGPSRRPTATVYAMIRHVPCRISWIHRGGTRLRHREFPVATQSTSRCPRLGNPLPSPGDPWQCVSARRPSTASLRHRAAPPATASLPPAGCRPAWRPPRRRC